MDWLSFQTYHRFTSATAFFRVPLYSLSRNATLPSSLKPLDSSPHVHSHPFTRMPVDVVPGREHLFRLDCTVRLNSLCALVGFRL
jgi:hypothetical protein